MSESRVREPGGRVFAGAVRAGATAALLACSAGMVGCTDSWLWDPSVVGRWEYTPTVVPILERIDVIERDRADYVEITPVTPEDLIPEVVDYQIGPGDVLNIEIFDLIQPNVPAPFQRSVDPRGFIDLPQIGRVHVMGLTADQVRERLRQLLREMGIIEDALVTVQIAGQRAQTFSIFGAIAGPGRYFIAAPDYRILEALTEAGGVPPVIKKVYVIRQVPLDEQVRRGAGTTDAPLPPPRVRPDGTRDTRPPADRGRDLTDLIEELTTPPPREGGGGASPGLLSDRLAARLAPQQGGGFQDEPPIDLVDESAPPRPVAPELQPAPDAGRWMFLNGEWVRVMRRPAGAQPGLPEGADPLGGDVVAQDLVTQRVIEIPTDPLLQGVAEYNIVIRPGDVIRVPSPASGQYYLGGPGIFRGGAFIMPLEGITLTRALMAAGGFSSIAVPWRVDLTRKLADDRQATIRLNLKAIYEGAQPDIYLRPDDIINVGTSFWATPLAVIRNGFRMSYGFGFLLDRNFGNDVFGAPPENRVGF